MKKIIQIIQNNLYILRFVGKRAPLYIMMSLFSGLLTPGVEIATLYITKKLFELYARETAAFAEAIAIILPFILVDLAAAFFNALLQQVILPRQSNRYHTKVRREIYTRMVNVDLCKFDDPDFYNENVMAMQILSQESLNISVNLFSVFSGIIGIVGVMTLMRSLGMIIVAVILLEKVLFFLLDVCFANKMYVQRYEELSAASRKCEYTNRIFYQKEYANELRCSKVSEALFALYRHAIDKKNSVLKKYHKKNVLALIAGDLSSTVLIDIFIMLYILSKVSKGLITIGDYTVMAAGVYSLSQKFSDMSSFLGELHKNSFYVMKVKTFLEYEPDIKSGTLSVGDFQCLSLKDACFSYDHSKTFALDHVSLDIRKGQRIAIVGRNGSGKTTLAKIMFRLYDLERGELRYNDIPVKMFDLIEYRKHYAAILQDFKLFSASLGENVLGDLYDPLKDRTAVTEGLKKAGIFEKFEGESSAYQCQLTRLFDENGIVLSGGEAQKVALARAFARDGELILCDEPSSSLDAVSEYFFHKTIFEVTKGKTVIIISHRLTMAKMADLILYVENGKIVEKGSHNELLQQNGKYAEMFYLQAEKYC